MGSAATFPMFTVTLLAVLSCSFTTPVLNLRRGSDLSRQGHLTGQLLARVRRQETTDVIPLDKQLKCGRWAVCDSRTQFCDEVVNSCSSCAGDVCNPVRYGVAGAERDCQLYCPEYWAKQQETTTTTPATTTATPASLNAVQNEDIAEIKEMLTQYHGFVIIVTIMAGLVMFLSVMAVFLAVKLYTKTPRYAPLPQTDPGNGSRNIAVNTEDGAGIQQRMKQASSSSLTTDTNTSTVSTGLESQNVSPSYAARADAAGEATGAKANPANRYSDATSNGTDQGKHVLAHGGEPVADPNKVDGLFNPNELEDTQVKGEHSSSSSSSSSCRSPSPSSATATGFSGPPQPEDGDLSAPPQCNLDERTRKKTHVLT